MYFFQQVNLSNWILCPPKILERLVHPNKTLWHQQRLQSCARECIFANSEWRLSDWMFGRKRMSFHQVASGLCLIQCCLCCDENLNGHCLPNSNWKSWDEADINRLSMWHLLHTASKHKSHFFAAPPWNVFSGTGLWITSVDWYSSKCITRRQKKRHYWDQMCELCCYKILICP